MKAKAQQPTNKQPIPTTDLRNQVPQRLQRRSHDNASEIDQKSSINSTTGPDYNFSQIPVFNDSPIRIQPKLKINAPGDRYEQEADRVMRTGNGQGSSEGHIGLINPMIQTKTDAQIGSPVSSSLANDIQRTRGGGQAMDAKTQSSMSSQFGTDFSGVRIHTGDAATQMNQEINAQAFTVGKDIYFNRVEYSPGNTKGKRLLAHELTHVVQQRGKASGLLQRQAQGNIKSLGKRFWTLDEAVLHALTKGNNSEVLRLIGSTSKANAKRILERFNKKDAFGSYFRDSGNVSKKIQETIVKGTKEKINPTPKAKKIPYTTADGKKVLLTQAEYKKLLRANKQIEAEFREIEADVKQRASTHQSYIQNQGLIGKGVDFAVGVTLPDLSIWKWPDIAVRNGRKALSGGDLPAAVDDLKKAKRKLVEAKTVWNTYISELGEGGKKIEEYSDKVSDKILEGVGVVKGAATQVTEVADTLVWVGEEVRDLRKKAVTFVAGEEDSAFRSFVDSQSVFVTGGIEFFALAGDAAKKKGWVDKDTGRASFTAPMAEKFNDASIWLEENVGRGKNDDYFTPLEIGELKGSIGTQAALSLVGAEEVKVAMNVIGILGSLRGIVEAIRANPDSWYKSKSFWVPLINMAVSVVGLKNSLASKKIVKFVLAAWDFGQAVPHLYEIVQDEGLDESKLSEKEKEAREKRIKQNWNQVIQILASAVLSLVQSRMQGKGHKSKPSSHDIDSPTTPKHAPDATPSHADVDTPAPLKSPKDTNTGSSEGVIPKPDSPQPDLYKAQPPKRKRPKSDSSQSAPEGRKRPASDPKKLKSPKQDLYKAKAPKRKLPKQDASNPHPSVEEIKATMLKDARSNPNENAKINYHTEQAGNPKNKVDSESLYFEMMRRNPDLESALIYNSQTGEYRVIQGDSDSVSLPEYLRKSKADIDAKAEGLKIDPENVDPNLLQGDWEVKAHSHPVDPRTNAVHPVDRFPSGFEGDFGAAMMKSRESGGTNQVSRIDYRKPDGTMDFTIFGYYPKNSKPFKINFPDPHTGVYKSKSFKSIREYNQWMKDKFGVIMDPSLYPNGTLKSPKKPKTHADTGTSHRLPKDNSSRDNDTPISSQPELIHGALDEGTGGQRLHLEQSNPENHHLAKQAGLPIEVYGGDWVMTRKDFPELIPNNPVPQGKSAPPRKSTKGRRVSFSKIQNLEVRADLQLTQKALEGSGAKIVDVRIDQTQVKTSGDRAGTNRPDLQLTILEAELNGRRIYIEYDRSPPDRALYHARRIIANDPDAIVVLKIIDFEK